MQNGGYGGTTLWRASCVILRFLTAWMVGACIFKGQLYLSLPLPLGIEPSCTSGVLFDVQITQHPCLPGSASSFLYQFSWDHFLINFHKHLYLKGCISGTQMKTLAVIITAQSVHPNIHHFHHLSILKLLKKKNAHSLLKISVPHLTIRCFFGTSTVNTAQCNGINQLQGK